MTKIVSMEAFVKDILVASSESDLDEQIVLFSDSDSFFNSFAVDLEMVLRRFDEARNGCPLLVSAEPNCYINKACDETDLKYLYPGATRASNCPQFVNSGQYMGSLTAMEHMLRGLMNMKNEDQPEEVHKNDQYRMAVFRAENPRLICLDKESSIFRSMSFGFVDRSKKGCKTCGTDAIASCGEFSFPFEGKLNMTTGIVELPPIPGCSGETFPFAIHYPGPTKNFESSSHMTNSIAKIKERLAI